MVRMVPCHIDVLRAAFSQAKTKSGKHGYPVFNHNPALPVCLPATIHLNT